MAMISASLVKTSVAEPSATGKQRQGYVLLVSFTDLRSLFRHAMLVDQNTEKVIVPLNANIEAEGRLELANSTFCVATDSPCS
jgi:probable 2-oxoglutarate dehydrogenase E1 component DHKTD1